MRIEPQKFFVISRLIGDPNDSNTYYVQAKIRDARTDALLDTVNLTDQGDRRFSSEWQVVADTSQQGRYITITTTVYTDSGYTTVSSDYYEELNTYLIKNDSKGGGSAGGHALGGGLDMTPKQLKKLIKEVIKEEIGSIKMPEIPESKEVDLSTIHDALVMIQERPQFEPTDMTELFNNLSEIKESLLKIPTEVQDLSVINDSLDIVLNNLSDGINDLRKATIMKNDGMAAEVKMTVQEMQKAINEMKEIVEKKEFNIQNLSLGGFSVPVSQGEQVNNRANKLRRL